MRILLVSILVALLSVFVFLLGERKKEIEGEKERERERVWSKMLHTCLHDLNNIESMMRAR